MAHKEDLESATARPGSSSSSSTDQVLSMLAKLERQLEHLGSVQRQQDERLSSLSPQGRKPAGSAEAAAPAKPAAAAPTSKPAAGPKPAAKSPPKAETGPVSGQAKPKARAGGAAWWQQHVVTDDAPVPAPAAAPEPEAPEASEPEEADASSELESPEDAASIQPEPIEDSPAAAPESASPPPAPVSGVSRADLEAVQGQIAALRSQLEQAEIAKVAAAENDTELRGQVGELTEQVETGRRELDARTEALGQATEALEQANGSIGELHGRIKELETALAARDKADEDDVEQVATLTEQVKRLNSELKKRDRTIADYQARLEDAVASLPEAPSEEEQGIIQQQRLQIERLTEQLQTMRSGADDDEEEDGRDERIAELEELVEQLQAQVASGGKGKGKGKAASKKEIEEYERRLEALSAECDRFREEAEQAQGQLQQHLDARAGGSTGDADAMQARIDKLERELREARMAVKAERTGLHIRQAEELRRQRELLAQAQRQLGETEQKMIRKWARPSSIVLFGCILFMALVVAGGSWLAAETFFPPIIVGQVELEGDPPYGKKLEGNEAEAWRTWHEGMLVRDDFHETVSARLADRRIEEYASPKALAARVRKDLTVDGSDPGRLVLSLAGTNDYEVVSLLDLIATTLARESSKFISSRTDETPAVVRGERVVGGQTRFATIADIPIRDQRLTVAIVVFAVGMLVCLMSMGKLYRWLLRTKRTVQEHQVFLETDGFDIDEAF